jgi:hypothetical protein
MKNPGFNGPEPPRLLGSYGRSLWDRVLAEFTIDDPAGLEMLCGACESLDRAERLREQIDRDDEIVRTKTGLRDHPGLRHELAARAFVSRSLQRLNLDVEPLRSGPGRPPGR